MAAPQGSTAAAAPAPRRSWFWVQGLACGVVVTTAAPLALVIAVLLAPSLLASIADPARGGARSALARIMLVYGVAAALPWGWVIWAGAQSWAASLDLLAAMRLPLIVWGAQGTAWLLSQLAPVAVRVVLETGVMARRAKLRDARAQLQAEWGLSDPAPEPTKDDAADRG